MPSRESAPTSMRRAGSTRLFGVLGDPVAHSLSPRMHLAAFRALGLDAAYLALPCTEAEVPVLMRVLARTGGGGNVTIPHKAVAAATLDRPSELVRGLGACNTFWAEDGALAGENTDVAGIEAAVATLAPPPGPWAVAGTGGAARAVLEAARRAGTALAVHSRSSANAERFRAAAGRVGVPVVPLEEAVLLINATPLGLRATDPMPFPGQAGRAARAVLDLVYAPGTTPWVRAARAAGIAAADGREMLLAQGVAAFELWFPGQPAPREVMRAALARALG